MQNDRIEQSLAKLSSLMFQNETADIRAVLEELYADAQDDLLEDLVGATEAAAYWNVSDRRARAHIVRLHEKYGIGRQFGGA